MFVRRLLVSAVLACLSACTAVPTPMSTNSTLQSNTNESTRIGGVNAMNHKTMPSRVENPHSTTQSNHSVADTSSCLRQKLATEFKLPAEFINHKVYTDNNHSVGLINPFTQTEGITMDVIGRGSSSEIKLYGNGNLLSRAWQQLPSKCGQGKTSTVAQIVPPSKTASTQMAAARPANNNINFVARTQDGTNNAWVDTRNNANVQTTTVTAPRVVNTPQVAAINTPTQTPSHPSIAAAQHSSATPSNWNNNTELTQDDMNIVAPLTAAMVAAPLAAKALSSSNNTQQLNNNHRSAVPATPTRTVTTNISNNRVAIASNTPTRTTTAANTSATRTNSTTTSSTAKRTTTNTNTAKKATTQTAANTTKKSSTKSNSSKAIVDNKKATRSQQSAQKATTNNKDTNKTAVSKKATSKTVASKKTTTSKTTNNKATSNQQQSNF
ncbi:hypothetical protein [Vitreoscilla stercoraria]|uniref:Uncharacterized protein n=1 Tax=Vitreoscilla stercoraria TaxID=61 RepID=A0ABY4E834_VITST|nr:hypothetical protein [Vitreoscilla stercoraria]UOO91622.1 hypothetical protein LVJ81_08175 [Vitreoscilla stercoraria]